MFSHFVTGHPHGLLSCLVLLRRLLFTLDFAAVRPSSALAFASSSGLAFAVVSALPFACSPGVSAALWLPVAPSGLDSVPLLACSGLALQLGNRQQHSVPDAIRGWM